MSKTKKSSSSGGGGGQQLQDTKPPRRENGVKLELATASHLFNGVAEAATGAVGGGGGFASIAQRERTMSGNSLRPSATCNSSTTEDRRHSSAGADSGDGATACSYVYESRPNQRPREPVVPLRTNGGSAATKYIDSRTTPIVRMLFYRTFTQANLDKDVIQRLDVEPIVKRLSPKEQSFVQDTCEKYLEYLGSSEKVSVDSHRRAFEVAGWEVSDNNVNAEFKKVVNQTFDENVTWGNVIGFLGFALGFSIFIHNRGMTRAVISVAEWTKQVIEDDIGTFFREHNGWVSELPPT